MKYYQIKINIPVEIAEEFSKEIEYIIADAHEELLQFSEDVEVYEGEMGEWLGFIDKI